MWDLFIGMLINGLLLFALSGYCEKYPKPEEIKEMLAGDKASAEAEAKKHKDEREMFGDDYSIFFDKPMAATITPFAGHAKMFPGLPELVEGIKEVDTDYEGRGRLHYHLGDYAFRLHSVPSGCVVLDGSGARAKKGFDRIRKPPAKYFLICEHNDFEMVNLSSFATHEKSKSEG